MCSGSRQVTQTFTPPASSCLVSSHRSMVSFFFFTSLRFVSLSPQNISTTVTSTEKLESLIMEKDEGGGLQKEGIIKKKKKAQKMTW